MSRFERSEELLTAAEVADELKIPRKRVYDLIHDENLPFIHLTARSFRIRRADLDAWIAARRTASVTPLKEL